MFYITDKHCENVNVSSFRRRNKHIFQSSAAQSKTKYAVRFVSQVKGESCLLVYKHSCSYVKFEADDIEQQSADAFV